MPGGRDRRRLAGFGRFSAYGKLGAYRGNAEGSGAALGANETNHGGTWGFGAQFELNPRLVLRREWQSYLSLAGGNLGQTSDVRVLSTGGLWRFRQPRTVVLPALAECRA